MRLTGEVFVLGCIIHPSRPAEGFISYDRTSEPHCQECCLEWENKLKASATREAMGMGLTMVHFRAWQAQKRQAA